MFWGFLLRLLIGDFLVPIVFSFMIVPLLGLLALTNRGKPNLSLLGYPVLALLLLAQLYFWGMWAAYCAALAVVRASHPDVTHSWLYYVVAFLCVTAPIGYLSSQEQASGTSAQEARGIQRGSTLYGAFAIVAFLAFSLWPGLMATPYSWFIALTVPVEGRGAQRLEEEYFRTLDNWVARGGPLEEVQATVVETCGNLVMLTATSNMQRLRLSTTDREIYHFRVGVCTKMTVNRVHPQPDLQQKETVSMICDRLSVELFSKLCTRSGLR